MIIVLMVKISMPAEAYPNLKQLDLPRCFVSVHHNFEMGKKLNIYPSLFNHLWGSNNPKILAPIPVGVGGGDGSTDRATRHNYSASDV